MKKLHFIFWGSLIGLLLFFGVFRLVVFAATPSIPITVPSATSSGYMLVSNSIGRYMGTTTDPAHFGTLFATSTHATSTFVFGLSVGGLNVGTSTGISATSTFANGIQLTSGCIKMPNGTCLAVGAGTINSGTTNRLSYYSGATTLDSANFLVTDLSNSFLGIGSTTPGTALSVQGSVNFLSDGTSTIYTGLRLPTINATSTTASSTFSNGINLYGGCFAILGVCSEPVPTGITGILEEANGVVSTVTVGNGLSYTGTTLTISAPVTLVNGGTNSSWLSKSSLLSSNAAGDTIIATSSPVIGAWYATTTSATSSIANSLYVASSSPFNGISANSAYFAVGSSTPNLWVDRNSGFVGIGTSSPSSPLDVKGGIYSEEIRLTAAATISVDWNRGTQQVVTLSQAGHTINFFNLRAGQGLRLVACQDGTGSRTVTTWDSQIVWTGGVAPTLTTTANKCDILTFTTTFGTSTVKALGGFVGNF